MSVCDSFFLPLKVFYFNSPSHPEIKIFEGEPLFYSVLIFLTLSLQNICRSDSHIR